MPTTSKTKTKGMAKNEMATREEMSGQTIPAEFIAAVATYQATREGLNSFIQQHRAVMEKYDKMRASVDEAEAEVKELYKTHHEAVGPNYAGFSAIPSRALDVVMLVELHPELVEEKVIKTEYKMSLAEFDKLVAAGRFDEELVSTVVNKKAPSIRGPE